MTGSSHRYSILQRSPAAHPIRPGARFRREFESGKESGTRRERDIRVGDKMAYRRRENSDVADDERDLRMSGIQQNVSLVKLSGVGIKGSGKIREIEGENVNEQQEEEDARDQASYSPGSGSRESLHPTSPTASASCCQSSVAQESAARPHRRRRTCSMRSPSNRSRPRRGRKAVQPGGRTGCRIGREGWRRTGNGMGTTFR